MALSEARDVCNLFDGVGSWICSGPIPGGKAQVRAGKPSTSAWSYKTKSNFRDTDHLL